MGWNNAYGKPSFYDLDESWYRYMAASRKERKEMCEEVLEMEGLALGILAVLGIGVVILGLIKGWI